MDSQKQEEAFSFLKDKKIIFIFVEAVVIKQPLFFLLKVYLMEQFNVNK